MARNSSSISDYVSDSDDDNIEEYNPSDLEIIDPCRPPWDAYTPSHFATPEPPEPSVIDYKRFQQPGSVLSNHATTSPAAQNLFDHFEQPVKVQEWGGWAFVKDPSLLTQYNRQKPQRGAMCKQDTAFVEQEDIRELKGTRHRVLPCDRSKCRYIHEGQKHYKESSGHYKGRVSRQEMGRWDDMWSLPRIEDQNVVKYHDEVGAILADIKMFPADYRLHRRSGDLAKAAEEKEKKRQAQRARARSNHLQQRT